jgi:hypothetical protein
VLWRFDSLNLAGGLLSYGKPASLADPVPAVVSGSTICGRGPNCASDVMGQVQTLRSGAKLQRVPRIRAFDRASALLS